MNGTNERRVHVSQCAWTPLCPLDSREWVSHGRRLGAVGRSVGWWIGDWLRYGNQHFGERYPFAARTTRLDVQTLMNMAWVASNFEPARRRESLSFSHHAELASLDVEVQDDWLDRAARERLSVRCLRAEVRRTRRAEGSGDREAQELEARTARAEAAAGAAVSTVAGHVLLEGEGQGAASAPVPRDEVTCPSCGCRFGQRELGAGEPHGEPAVAV